MRLDKFSHPIFDSNDILEALYQGHVNFNNVTVEKDTDIEQFEQISNTSFQHINSELEQIPLEEYDSIMQADWFIPLEYSNLDIISWIRSTCETDIEIQRINEELTEFKNRKLVNLLRWLKYFVDTCKNNNVLWGIGRGSSTASYVLFKIGVHKVDSIKYNLDWKEFFKI